MLYFSFLKSKNFIYIFFFLLAIFFFFKPLLVIGKATEEVYNLPAMFPETFDFNIKVVIVNTNGEFKFVSMFD